MKKLLLCLLVAMLPLAAAAETGLRYQYDSGLGADGYDVVAYFTDNRAVRGVGGFAAEYDGQTWQFVSAGHRDAFIAAPEKYAPHYGGYCAYAASLNALAFGDPQAWTVRDGALYFNFSKPVRARWEADAANHIVRADKNWPQLSAGGR